MYYYKLFSIENLFFYWHKLKSGKSHKKDFLIFESNLEENIFDLYSDLQNKIYIHGEYKEFFIFDKKKRTINKANVKDRLVNLIIYNYLLKLFKSRFVRDTYSSLKNRGADKALGKLKYYINLEQVQNPNKNIYVFKFDIQKYFKNIDHNKLFLLIEQKVKDRDILDLIEKIIASYDESKNKGIPLGNVTSQVFANIYLYYFDLWVIKDQGFYKYIRYNDDFIFVTYKYDNALKSVERIRSFLENKFDLFMPLEKIKIYKTYNRVYFLGKYIKNNKLLLTKKVAVKFLKKADKNNFYSYTGIASHLNDDNLLKSSIIAKILLYY